MRILHNTLRTDSSVDGATVRDRTGARDTLQILKELLAQSINLRDLYQKACWQTSDIRFRRLRRVLDDHYREQIRLIDVLIDRIHTLGGSGGVFARELLPSTQFCCALRGRRTPSLLLGELLDAHESVLSVARLSEAGETHEWCRDFAVGQVVLTNDFQSQRLSDECVGSRFVRESQCHW